MGIRGFQYGTVLVLLLLAVATAEAATVEFDEQGFIQQAEATSAQKLTLEWPRLLRLYEILDGRLIWHTDDALNERGRRLFARLKGAEADGLEPAEYHLYQLQRMGDRGPAGRLARELLLSDGYLRLARDLRRGTEAARALDPFGKVTSETFDPVVALVEALAREGLDELLADLAPASAGYKRLRQVLTRYRRIEAAGGWPRLESDHSLRPAQRDPLVSRLRERLAIEAIEPAAAVEDPELFDDDLLAELRRFQSRHGLKADGVVGPATLKALNVPVAWRIDQIRANLERWRWLPHELPDEYLLVNTAGFTITLQSHGRVVFSARTVNGSEERQTPSMVGRITHLVANPRWTVPRRIAVEDMLPHQQADKGYLSRIGIRVYRRKAGAWEEFDPATIDWSPFHRDNFPFVFKQEAGAGNSLGRIKFHMPNRQAVFLHGTPTARLFGKNQRALSSGCVRVEQAERLARLLIARADPWEGGKFIRALRSGETLETGLKEPITVYLTYFTSWVDREGEVHFRPDIYRRDTDLMLAIDGREAPVMARRGEPADPPSL